MANPDPIVQKVIVEVSSGGGGGGDDPFNAIRERMRKFVEDTKTFGEGIERSQTGTIESIEKMRAAWAAMGDTGFDELNKKIADSLDSIKQPLTELDKALRAVLDGSFTPDQQALIEKYFKTIEDGAGFAAAKLGTGFEKLTQGTGDYVENLRLLVGAVSEGAKAMTGLNAANMENSIGIAKAGSNIQGFSQLQEDLAGALQKGGISLADSADHLLTYGKAASESVPPVEKLAETTKTTGKVIEDTTKDVAIDAEKLKEAMLAWATTGKVAADQWNLIIKAFGSPEEAAKQLTEEAEKAAKQLVNTGESAKESAGGIAVLDKELKDGLDSIAHMSTAFRTMGIAMDRFGPLGQTIGTVFRALSGVLAIVDTTVGRLSPSLETAMKTLEHLGPAGKTAAEGLKSVVDAIGDAIKGIPEGVSVFTRLATVIKTGFVAAAEAALAILGPFGLEIAAIVVAATALQTAIVYFGNKAIQTAASLRELSAVTGQSITQIQQGEIAFREMGIATEQYGEISKKVAEIVAEMGPTLAKSMDESANAVKQAQKAAQDATKTMLELRTGGRFQGVIGDDFSQQIKDQQTLQAIYRDQTDEKKKLADATEDARQKEARAEEATANKLRTITDLMGKVIEGAKNITFPTLTTETTKITALEAKLTEMAQHGQSAIEGLVTAMRNLPFGEALAMSKSFGISPDALRSMRDYGEGIKEIREQIAASGRVPITEEDNRKLEEAGKSTSHLAAEWHRLLELTKTPIINDETMAKGVALLADILAFVLKWSGNIVEGWGIIYRGFVHFFSMLPEVAAKVLADIRIAWFTAWAAMAEIVGNIFSKLPGALGRFGDSIKQMAAGWREAAQQASNDWNKAQQDINKYWANIEKAAKSGGDAQVNAANQSAEAVKNAVPAILTWGQALDHTGGDVKAAAEYVNNFNKEASKTSQTVSDLSKTGGQAGEQVAQGLQKPAPAVDELNSKVKSLNETLTKLSESKELKVDINFDEIQKSLDELVKQLAAAAEGIAKSFDEIKFTNLVQEIDSATEAFKNMEQAAYKAAKASSDAGGGSTGGGGATETGGGGGFAIGGLFRGRGGTDTNLAWLSDYEFIMRAEAVKKYGVSFMQLINAGRFASGGLVGGLSTAEDIAQLPQASGSSSDGADVNIVNSALDDIGQTLDDFLHGTLKSLKQIMETMVDQLRDVFGSINDIVVSMATALYKIAYAAGSKAGAKDQWDKDQEEFTKIAEQLQKDAGKGAQGKAEGGLFRGKPGTDTNLAWLTDYEFVMRPEAVSKYGVAFMHMINALAFPFGGFASGGLVMPRFGIPAFRAGGINGGGAAAAGRPLTLVLDGQRFPNLSGPAAVVDGLEKHATMSKASRIGRAPSWVK